MNPLKFVGITLIVVLALGVLGVGVVFAQWVAPSSLRVFGTGGMMGNVWNGNGMMGGAGMMGSYRQNEDGAGWMDSMHQWMTTTGGMHVLVWDRLAEALGLTPEELNVELSSGKTLAQVAEEKGIILEDLSVILENAVRAGLEDAVADGVLTQEQAEDMLSHMAGNYIWMLTHMGSGTGAGTGSCHGNGVPQDNS